MKRSYVIALIFLLAVISASALSVSGANNIAVNSSSNSTTQDTTAVFTELNGANLTVSTDTGTLFYMISLDMRNNYTGWSAKTYGAFVIDGVRQRTINLTRMAYPFNIVVSGASTASSGNHTIGFEVYNSGTRKGTIYSNNFSVMYLKTGEYTTITLDTVNSSAQINRSQVNGQELVDTTQNSSILSLQVNDTYFNGSEYPNSTNFYNSDYNTHLSSNGSDHTYIDQDVTSGASPTFTGENISNLYANKTIITDTASHYNGAEVETALAEIANGTTLNESYLLRSAWWGTFQEAFNALLTSDGTNITLSIQSKDGGDLTMQFSDALTVLDTTPALNYTLTAGTNTSPQANYVYILQSNKIITHSTSDWPSAEHIKIGYFYVQSAAYVQSDGALINQNWNDPLSNGDNTGHVTHVGQWIRAQGANYFSGIGGGGTDGYLTPYSGGATFQVNSGVIMQMHKHSYTAKNTSNGDDIHVINYPSEAFKNVHDLNEMLLDSTGGSLTNDFYNIILIGIANKGGEYSPLMIKLPAGSYNSVSNAINDVDSYDDYSLPREFSKESSTGFLIARITIKNVNDATFTVHNTQDLRGARDVQAGGSIGGTALTDFSDSQFTIYNNLESTKILNFNTSAITAGNTRTISVIDAAMTMFSTTNHTDLTDGGNSTLHSHAYDRSLTYATDSLDWTKIFNVSVDLANNVTGILPEGNIADNISRDAERDAITDVLNASLLAVNVTKANKTHNGVKIKPFVFVVGTTSGLQNMIFKAPYDLTIEAVDTYVHGTGSGNITYQLWKNTSSGYIDGNPVASDSIFTGNVSSGRYTVNTSISQTMVANDTIMVNVSTATTTGATIELEIYV